MKFTIPHLEAVSGVSSAYRLPPSPPSRFLAAPSTNTDSEPSTLAHNTRRPSPKQTFFTTPPQPSSTVPTAHTLQPHLQSAKSSSRMSIENLKSFDPFAEADEGEGQVKQSQQDYIHIRIQRECCKSLIPHSVRIPRGILLVSAHMSTLHTVDLPCRAAYAFKTHSRC